MPPDRGGHGLPGRVEGGRQTRPPRPGRPQRPREELKPRQDCRFWPGPTRRPNREQNRRIGRQNAPQVARR